MRKLWIALSILLFLFSLSVGHMFFQWRNANQERKAYEQITQERANRIAFLMDVVAKRADKLRNQFQLRHAKNINFSEEAQSLCNTVQTETGVSLKLVALAPRGKISEVYPRASNESLIGLNFFDRKRNRTDLEKQAFQKGESLLDILVPSERTHGLIGYRAPILWKVKDEQKFWGFLALAVNLEDFCRAAEIDDLEEQGLNYRLFFISDNGDSFLLREKGIFYDKVEPIRIFFHLKNLTWELQTSPKDEPPPSSFYGVAGAVLSGLAIFCLIGLAVKKQRIPDYETD